MCFSFDFLTFVEISTMTKNHNSWGNKSHSSVEWCIWDEKIGDDEFGLFERNKKIERKIDKKLVEFFIAYCTSLTMKDEMFMFEFSIK